MSTQPTKRDAPKFVSNGEVLPLRDTSAWPVIKSYAPFADIWKATGHGTAAIIRQQPDGLYAFTAFHLSLVGGGIRGAFGKYDLTLEAAEALHKNLQPRLPPHEEAPTEETSAYLWGAFIFAKENNFTFPKGQLEPFLQLIPKPPGASELWKKKLFGIGGKTPPALVAVLKEGFKQKANHRDFPVWTTNVFSHPDFEKVRETFSQPKAGVFFDTNPDKSVYLLSREDPDSHPNIRNKTRQKLAKIHLQQNNELVLQCAQLPVSAMLIGFLRKLLGEDLKYKTSEWRRPPATQSTK